jgi:uncharacterized protein YdeI (YjbR/CyaY-like superfamily)
MTKLPSDLLQALEAAGLAVYFKECTNAHRREYLNWIGQAKRPETRRARIEKAVQMIGEKRGQEQRRE